jgi:hypothetical protein
MEILNNYKWKRIGAIIHAPLYLYTNNYSIVINDRII